MKCPRCDATIAPGAAGCGCGWREQSKGAHEPERRCDCCYAGCPRDAAVKVKAATGWANMCHEHLQIFLRLHAEKYCNDLGLHTFAQRRAHFGTMLKKFIDKSKAA